MIVKEENEKELFEIEDNDQMPSNNNNGSVKRMESVFDWIDSFIFSIAVVILLFTLVLGKVEVSGNSMLDTLHNGDQLLITGYNYTPKNGDIVILSKNSATTEAGKQYSEKPLVKRIVATEGQTVEIKDGYLYVDDKKQIEDYARTATYDNGFVGKKTVPQDCVFVMGDNRGDSADSRIIGFVDRNHILGKVLCRIFPFNSVRTF